MKIERVDAEIQKVLSDLIRNELRDPRLDNLMISIMRVETTRDLKYCKVFVSFMGEGNAEDGLQALKASAGYLKKLLFAKLKIRAVPDLLFHKDDSVEYGFKIEKILKDLN